MTEPTDEQITRRLAEMAGRKTHLEHPFVPGEQYPTFRPLTDWRDLGPLIETHPVLSFDCMGTKWRVFWQGPEVQTDYGPGVEMRHIDDPDLKRAICLALYYSENNHD